MDLFNMDHDEWIQNDWESDDYIEQEARREAERQKTTVEEDRVPEENGQGKGISNGAAIFLAIVITIAKSPVFWILLLVFILVKC